MRAPQKEFERMPVGDFINARIDNVIYDEHHEFSVYQSEETERLWGVQFVLSIAGIKDTKKTRWYKFSYDKKANLYKLFIAPLVEGAQPYMEFDLDQLKGMEIKMLWKDDNDPRYQSIETIRPMGKKLISNIPAGPQPIFNQDEEPTDGIEP